MLKSDEKIIELLKVTELRRVICNTDKGFLNLCIRKGENTYFFTLDSVPLEEEINKELMEVLYLKQVEVPQVIKSPTVITGPVKEVPLKLWKKDKETKKK